MYDHIVDFISQNNNDRKLTNNKKIHSQYKYVPYMLKCAIVSNTRILYDTYYDNFVLLINSGQSCQ